MLATTEDIHSPVQGGDITYMDMVDERNVLGESRINRFLAGSTIFLTGGTGFIGKLLIEKLLRSCSEINKIYLLARPKKNKEVRKRLQEQFDDVLYEKLRKQQPDFFQKLDVINGDLTMADLGISEGDRKKLSEEVDIIFHGAATVRFDESLKIAVAINVRGTREMLRIARTCKKLKAFVHTSTAYSYCPLKVIEEKFYNSPIPADQLIDLTENVDEKVLNDITKGLLGEYPNTYVYTKAVAEDVVLNHGKGLPVAMVRPSIIVGTAREPVAGWIDNIYGPTGIVIGATLGMLHTLRAKKTRVADMVPGDMVVNTLIAAAWRVSRESLGNDEEAQPIDAEPPVYNYVSGPENPITWQAFMHYNELYGLKVPPVKTIWYYLLLLNENKYVHMFWSFLLHWLPAYIVDGVLMVLGKKPMLRKAYMKIQKFSNMLSYFAMNEWKYSNGNTRTLFQSMCKADQYQFSFDMPSLDWDEYFTTYVKGVRIYLLQDPLDTIPQGLSRHRKLMVAHYSLIVIICFLLLRLLWGAISSVLGF